MNLFFTAYWAAAQSALSGLNSTLQGVAYTVLIVTLLLGVYESFFAGGSLCQLAVTFVKFGVAAAVIGNWTDLVTDVVQAGTFIASVFLHGGDDVIANWATSIQSTVTQSGTGTGFSIVSLLTTGADTAGAGLVEFLIIGVSTILFFLAMKILTICFVFWGGILYCMGPMLIALSPSGLVSSHVRSYCRSLAEWALWPALYAMFCTLMTTVSMGNTTQVLGAQQVAAGGDSATNQTMVLALISLLYGICMIIIPFIAHYVVGSSFAGVAAGVAAVIKTGAGAAGMGKKPSSSESKVGGSGSVSVGGGSSSGSGGGGGSIPASSPPSMPPPPSMAEVAVRRASAPPVAAQ